MKQFNSTLLKAGLLCSIFFLFIGSPVKAVDRIVQELGGSGTFPSITSAVNAASDGDRIIIFNRAGGLPWQETVTVGKSLTFLPAVDGIRFLVLGDWNISPTASGKDIRIVGMENLGGDVRANNNAPAGTRTEVEIVGCKITGDLEFDRDYFDMLVASNEILAGASGFDGRINISYGNIYGNTTGGAISFNSDAIPGNEIFDMIGNTCPRMDWNSDTHFFRIANNNIQRSGTGSWTTLFIGSVKNSSAEINNIENNSVFISGSSSFSTHYGIYLNNINATNATINMLNNAVVFSGGTSPTTYGIYKHPSATYSLFAAYNHIATSFDNELTNIAGTLNVIASMSMASTGLPSGSSVLDGGHPGKDYIDHDLSRNDPGCFGGSFNITNYSVSAAPVIFHVETPRTVLQGSTLNVTSEGFDR